MNETSDPIVMYLIVRESLGMSPGKIAAQCGHAVQYVMIANEASNMNFECSTLFHEWLFSPEHTKIVLQANEKEFAKVKEELNKTLYGKVVTDFGKTELEPMTETVIGLYPMRKSVARQTIIKKLQLLK